MVILVNIENYTYGDDKIFFEPGDLGYQVFETPIGRIAMLVCFWYFENWRILKLMGADIVCCPTNGSIFRQQSLGENGERIFQWSMPTVIVYFAIAADRIGLERGCKISGRSCIVGPDGWF